MASDIAGRARAFSSMVNGGMDVEQAVSRTRAFRKANPILYFYIRELARVRRKREHDRELKRESNRRYRERHSEIGRTAQRRWRESHPGYHARKSRE